MSEPDSTPHRRPPTIDLTAKEVETEQTASPANNDAADATGAAAGGRDSRNFFVSARPYAIGGVAGVIAAAAVIAGLWTAGFGPTREVAAPPVASSAKPALADEISSRLDKIQQALQAPPLRSDQALAARVAAVETQAKALGDSLNALTHRLDEIAAANQDTFAKAGAAAAAAAEAKDVAQAGAAQDVEALAERIAALEDAVFKSLTADVAQRAAGSGDGAARMVVAAEALRAAVERGVSYRAELSAVKSLGADPNATAALEPFAADGVPSAAVLGRELAALVPALRQAAEPASSDHSFLGRLEANAQKLVRVTPIDASSMPAGDGTAAVVARINADAARGDSAVALADLARLPDAARAPAQAWIKKAQAREAAIAASERIAAAALAALGKPASQ